MINTLLGKVFGTKNEREVKRLMPRVAAINALEPEMKKLTDDQLRAKTVEFRARIQERLSSVADEPDAGPDRLQEIEAQRSAVLKVVLDELLEEAFAVCREAGWRVLNMRHFDVHRPKFRTHLRRDDFGATVYLWPRSGRINPRTFASSDR